VSNWACKFGNLQVSPRRLASAPSGSLKAAAVRQAACVLREHGINEASQIDINNVKDAKLALRSVPGIGYATSNYFLMLLGAPGVKPDRMIHRFLKEATGHAFTDTEAERTTWAAAEQLCVQSHELDHAIWRFESMRAQQRPRGRQHQAKTTNPGAAQTAAGF
jgi:ribosomal protein S13